MCTKAKCIIHSARKCIFIIWLQRFSLNYRIRAEYWTYKSHSLCFHRLFTTYLISLRNLITVTMNYYYVDKALELSAFLKKGLRSYKPIYIAFSFIYAYRYILCIISRLIVYRILSWKHFDLINIRSRISMWAFECTTLLVIGDCINCNAVDPWPQGLCNLRRLRVLVRP